MSLSKQKTEQLRPRQLPIIKPGEEVVISGIAGRFPECDNMEQLKDKLSRKVDLVTSDYRRWKLNHPDIPQRTGKVNNIEKFDASFFHVDAQESHVLDPMCRVLLEHAHESIIDAGQNPKGLRGRPIGVFIGACFSESERSWFYDDSQSDGGFGITGCSRSMLANRISHYLGVTGPSYAIDTACSSALYAIEHAYRAIHTGLCEAALVGTGNLCLHPYVSLQFAKLGVLSSDGRCKTFDESANGYVRAEALCVVFLQKAKDAKRLYATLVHAKVNCDGFKEEGITFPSSHMQSLLLREFYEECAISPTVVSYVEAHGTGTKVGDPEEVNAIDRVFCQNRPKHSPLLIGSVKSNLGHSEPASGLVSIAKVIIAMETGVIPPNINFKQCKRELKGILEGRMRVVTECTPWEGNYAGINAFGFGGANAHVLLKSNAKEKVNGGAAKDDLPWLVVVSGRTEEAVKQMIADLESKAVDVEYVALLHNIYSEEIVGHWYRGYTILPPRGIVQTSIMEVKPVSGIKRPIWFVFSGMGWQWPAMGEVLLRMPIFAKAIEKCDTALKPLGIDIFQMITRKNETTFDSIVNVFVGIAAVQIGLVDILFALGINPNNLIGHSIGEFICAYADGCLSAEQTILSAYSSALALFETKLANGLMADVGLGYEHLKKFCPSDIHVACHNSSDCTTISGPVESMDNFMAKVEAKNIAVEKVVGGNIPLHSHYIAPAKAKLLSYLEKVIPEPKLRSSKWVSTSIPMDKWNTQLARYSSAEYHTNNLLAPVLFEETSTMIPKDAIAIEIAPHAILRKFLDSSVTKIPLTQRGHKDNVEELLQALGKIFNAGLQPQLSNLYPVVDFPVSRSTPMISPLIKWQHKDDWYVASYKLQEKNESGGRVVKISILDSEYESLAGHVIDGRNLFPATAYLTLIWEMLGIQRGELYTELSVVFEDVRFLRATTLPKDGELELTLMINKGSKYFEVIEDRTALVTGYVRLTSEPSKEMFDAALPEIEEELMSSRDIYKLLQLRGYQYTGNFRSISRASISGSQGHIVWRNDWVAFIDNILQMKIIGMDTNGLFVPTSIGKMVIDSEAHQRQVKFGETDKEFPVFYNSLHNVLTCGGVEIVDMDASAIPRRKMASEPIVEMYNFHANLDSAQLDVRSIVRIAINVAMENQTDTKVKTIELIDVADEIPHDNLLSMLIWESLNDLPLIQADVRILSARDDLTQETLADYITLVNPIKSSKASKSALLVAGNRLLTDERVDNLNSLLGELKPAGFLLTRENENIEDIENVARSKNLHVISIKKCASDWFVLLRKQEESRNDTIVIQVDNENLDWVDRMREIMSRELEKEMENKSRIVFVGQGDYENGLIGLVNCLRQEPGGDAIRGVLIQDPKALPFSLENEFYDKQIQKDLVINVLRENGVWGTYRHLPLSPLKPIPLMHQRVQQLVRGDLSSLTWTEGPITNNDSNAVRVVYSALNFRDVMVATGKLAVEVVAETRQEQDCVLGSEFSGYDQSGRRVMGLISSRALSNLVIPDEDCLWEVPESWSLEDAATVPCVYATCIFAFYLRCNLRKGKTVLIHSGTGGVGQAAINLALAEGCEVFTTVGTSEKRRFIRERYPQIDDNHIGDSRKITFRDMIRSETKGRGVDVVLNSLSGEKLIASLDCLAAGGTFLEIGKVDLVANNPLDRKYFCKGIGFSGIMLDRLLLTGGALKLKLKDRFNDLLKKGTIKPLVRTVFPDDQVEEAFRFMSTGKHIGKVLIRVRDENKSIDSIALALPQFYCVKDRSYIILGGLGGFGLELADWLVLRGAKTLVITSRRGLTNGYQRMRIELWKSYGVNVLVISGKDASSGNDCRSILETATKLAPVDAIFNLAVVLMDALAVNQTVASFQESFKSKARATKNLDQLSRQLCPDLRHFVVFSSVSCGRGNAGQSNYGMSNSVMERICEKRVAERFPGLAIQWGAIADVGLVADMQEDNKELVIGGTLPQSIHSCLQVLDGFLRQDQPIVSCMLVAADKKTGTIGSLNILQTVQHIMGLKDLNGVNPNALLAELGMDSMMSVEIKQSLERNFGMFLTPQDIRNLTYAKLQEMIENNEAQE